MKPTREPAPGDSHWLSPRQAAKQLGVSVDTIYDACRTKGLRHCKLGHSTVRIHQDWLEAWMLTRATVSE